MVSTKSIAFVITTYCRWQLYQVITARLSPRCRRTGNLVSLNKFVKTIPSRSFTNVFPEISLPFHELLYASTDALAIGVSFNKFTKKDMIPWLDPEWWTLICIRPCGHLPVFLMSPMGQDNKKTIRYNRKANNDRFGTIVGHFFTICFPMLSTVFLMLGNRCDLVIRNNWIKISALISIHLINVKFKTI